jgi:hypothetical protein
MAAVTHADSKSLRLHGKYASEFTRQLASSAPASTLHLPGIPATSAFLRLLTCHQMHGARRCKDQNTSHQHHPGTSSFQCKDIIVTESQHGNTWLNHRSGHPCGSNWHAHVAARTHGNTHTHTQQVGSPFGTNLAPVAIAGIFSRHPHSHHAKHRITKVIKSIAKTYTGSTLLLKTRPQHKAISRKMRSEEENKKMRPGAGILASPLMISPAPSCSQRRTRSEGDAAMHCSRLSWKYLVPPAPGICPSFRQ